MGKDRRGGAPHASEGVEVKGPYPRIDQLCCTLADGSGGLSRGYCSEGHCNPVKVRINLSQSIRLQGCYSEGHCNPVRDRINLSQSVRIENIYGVEKSTRRKLGGSSQGQKERLGGGM